jgi:hypothetical protein
MPESNWERAARYAGENVAFRAAFERIDNPWMWRQPTEALGAINFERRPDGVWEMPK